MREHEVGLRDVESSPRPTGKLRRAPAQALGGGGEAVLARTRAVCIPKSTRAGAGQTRASLQLGYTPPPLDRSSACARLSSGSWGLRVRSASVAPGAVPAPVGFGPGARLNLDHFSGDRSPVPVRSRER